MSSPETFFWWRLAFNSLPELEESFFWKMESLGINRVAVQYALENPDERTFFVWLPSFEWPKLSRDNLINSLRPLAKSHGLFISSVTWEKVLDEDWSKSWKQHWKPDAVGQNLLILPAWLDVPEVHTDRLILRLDPGSAFGTGSHPTTRLCLQALENDPPQNLRVADLGCGSGILSLAALGLGAKEVFAVDIDSLAIRASLENQRLNQGFKGHFCALMGSVDALKEEIKGHPVDLILCNILAPVIEELAPSFDELLSSNGRALLSGLLVDQSPRLIKLFKSLGWIVSDCLIQDQWGLLEISKPEAKTINKLYK